jgi:uncharacterized protein
VLVQSVSHPSRVHIDIETDDQLAEVARLEKLGARRVQHVKRWWVMEAPTGQRFCVVNPQRADFESEAHVWSGAAAAPALPASDAAALPDPQADPVDSILWRRLDAPGHDACRLMRGADGWRIEGSANYLHDGVAASLAYRVDCDRDWRTRQARVQGWIGPLRRELHVARNTDGSWTLDGRTQQPGLHHCSDLDLGFTPATNLLHVRRTALAVGQSADVPVAWLDVSAGTLDLLEQRYERRSERSYRYQAPRFEFDAELSVRPSGFVERYADVWIAEQ